MNYEFVPGNVDGGNALHISVPAGKRLAMSAIRAAAVMGGGHVCSWVPSPSGTLSFQWVPGGGGYSWVSPVLQRAWARLQPAGESVMDWEIGRPDVHSPKSFGFGLRDTEQPPTAFPQDFMGAQEHYAAPDWCIEKGFEFYVACTCGGDAYTGNQVYPSRFSKATPLSQPDSWEFQVRSLERLRNDQQPYDYLVYVAFADHR